MNLLCRPVTGSVHGFIWNQRMLKRSKNLIFIDEKSDIKYDVSSNLVRLYMNRSIIDEDDEFEILGVIEFISENSWTQYGHTFDGDMVGYLKTKIEKYLNITSEVMIRSIGAQNLDTHLIVGLPIPHILQERGSLDRFLWTERSRYWNDDLPILVAKSITSEVQTNYMSNELWKLSSFTVLNEWQNRTMKDLEIERRAYMDLEEASFGGPNAENLSVNQVSLRQLVCDSLKQVKTIDQDVDCFFEHLSRFQFQGLNRFQRFRRFQHSKMRILGSIDHPLIQWREGFRRYKLSEMEIDEDIVQFFLAGEAMLEELLDFNDDDSIYFDDDDSYIGRYIEYLGNRFTYY